MERIFWPLEERIRAAAGGALWAVERYFLKKTFLAWGTSCQEGGSSFWGERFAMRGEGLQEISGGRLFFLAGGEYLEQRGRCLRGGILERFIFLEGEIERGAELGRANWSERGRNARKNRIERSRYRYLFL